MGWKDAPEVESGAAWQSAPEVGATEAPKEPLKIGREGFAQAMRETLAKASPSDRFLSSVYSTMVDQPALRLQQMAQAASGGQTPENAANIAASREMAAASLPGAVTGSIAGPVGRVLGPMSAGAGLAAAPAYASIPAAGAIGAAANLATNPTLPGESEMMNAGVGALGGAGGQAAISGVARAAQPIMQSEAVKALTERGIIPTIGQSFGPRSIVNRVEQQISSLPVIGWFTRGARDRATMEMNVDRIRQSVPPQYRDTIERAGRESVDKADEIVDGAYDAIYSRIPKPVKVDWDFEQAIKGIPNRAGINLPDSMIKQFDRTMRDLVTSRAGLALLKNKSEMDAQLLRTIHNDLGQEARDYLKSTSTTEQRLGKAFQQAKLEFRDMVSRQSGGDFKDAMGELDKVYATLGTVKAATERSGSKEGIFSAEAYRQTAKSGPTEGRNFAKTAADVLGGTEPDSGTAGRALLAYGLGGAAAGGNDYLGGPEWLTAALLAPAVYNRMGQRYALGDYAWQPALGAGLRSLSPQAIIAGQQIANKP